MTLTPIFRWISAGLALQLLCGAAVVPLTAFAALPEAPDWVGTIKPGTWQAVSVNTIRDVDPAIDPSANPNYPHVGPWNGNTGVKSVIIAWSGGTYASGLGPAGSLIYMGGGHYDYFGNELYQFDLASRKWSRLANPYAGADVGSATSPDGSYANGSPIFPHTYDYLEYEPSSNSFVLLRSVTKAGGTNESAGGRPFSFDLSSHKWQMGSFGPPLLAGGVSAYDSKRDLIWVESGNAPTGAPVGLYSFDAKVINSDGTIGQWSQNYGRKASGTATAATYDSDDDLYVALSSDAGTILAVDLKDPFSSAVKVLQLGARPAVAARQGLAGWEWSEKQHAIIYWRRGGDVWAVFPPLQNWKSEAWVWEKITDSANVISPPDMTADNGIWSRFRIARFANGEEVALVCNDVDGAVYAFRIPQAQVRPSRPDPVDIH